MTTIRSRSEAKKALRRHLLMLDAIDQAEYEGKPFSTAHRLWLLKEIASLRSFIEQARKREQAA